MKNEGGAQAGAAEADQSGAVSIEDSLEAAMAAVDDESETGTGTSEAGTDGDAGAAAGDGDGGDGTQDGTDEAGADGDGAEGADDATDGDGTDDGEAGETEDQFAEGELEGVRPDAQQKINKRIGYVTAKRKEAEEQAATAQAQADEAAERATKAEARLQDTELREAFAMGIHPSYLEKAELQVLKQDRELAEMEAWLLDNFDGYEGSGEKDDPSYEAKEVRKRYRQIVEQRRPIAARAESLRTERLQQMLKDMEAGRALRVSGKAPGQAGTKPKPGTPAAKRKPLPKPPAVPAAGTGAGAPPVGASRVASGFSAQRVMEHGASAEALENEFEKLF